MKSSEWKTVVMEEMEVLNKNKTWDFCTLLEGHKTMGCKLVFTLNYKSDGTLNRYKARFVAKKFTQTYRINYLETFSPVSKLNATKVFMSAAVNKEWHHHQLDVKNAFLNGDLKEEAYMSPPPSFEV